MLNLDLDEIADWLAHRLPAFDMASAAKAWEGIPSFDIVVNTTCAGADYVLRGLVAQAAAFGRKLGVELKVYQNVMNEFDDKKREFARRNSLAEAPFIIKDCQAFVSRAVKNERDGSFLPRAAQKKC